MNTLCLMGLMAFILNLSSCLDLNRESPGTNIKLSELPQELQDAADSLVIIVDYGGKSDTLYQGTQDDPGFMGPYQLKVDDYQEEDLVYKIYQFDAKGDLIKTDSTTYIAGEGSLAHVVSIKAGPHGSVAPKGDTVIFHKDSLEITAAPEEHYHFVNWSVEGDFSLADSLSATTHIQQVTNSGTISAHFSKDTLTITLNASGNGKVAPGKKVVVDYGDSLKIKAIPDSNHHFTGWSVDGDLSLSDSSSASTVIHNIRDAGKVTANFEIDLYTITFIAGKNGRLDDKDTVVYKVEHGKDCEAVKADPSKGYLFSKWAGEDFESSDNPITLKNVTSDISITASFTKKSYKVTFKAGKNGRVGDNKLEVSENVAHGGNSDAVKATPELGYKFAGWTGISSTDNPLRLENVTAEKTVTANFELIKSRVVYTSGPHGKVNLKDTIVQIIDYGKNCLPVKANPASGYHFTGWTGDLSSHDNPLEITIVTEAMAVKANFAIDTFVLAITSDHGSVDKSPDKPAYDSGTVVTLTAKPSPGYLFNNWSGDATGKSKTIDITMDGNKEITANWLITQSTVTFNSRGGSAIASQKVDYGGTVEKPDVPTRTGYAFEGWFKESACINPWIFETDKVTSKVTMYAKWSVITYKIIYNLNGGTNGDNPAKYNINTSTITLAAPETRTGYNFKGWFDNPDFSGSAVTTIPQGSAGDKELWAKWTIIQYSITYNLNGGTNGDNPADYNINTPKITFAPATKTGYNFDGWFANSDLTGSAVKTIPQGYTGDKELWAKWTIIQYSITYKLNGGTGGDNPADYNINTPTITLDGPAPRTGFNFEGWFDNPGFSGNAATTIPQGSTGDKELWAKWTWLDTRDGKSYKIVTIGTQTWMAENYNYKPSGSDSGWCYENISANCEKYGRLYDWFTANAGSFAPAGWHIPTSAEWRELEKYLIANGYNWDGTTANDKVAKSMAAQTDWYESIEIGTIGNNLKANNSTGFSALPGGYRDSSGDFRVIGKIGSWWSATGSGSRALNYRLYRSREELKQYLEWIANGNSVRLLRD